MRERLKKQKYFKKLILFSYFQVSLNLAHNELDRCPVSLEQYWCGTMRTLYINNNQLEEINESIVKLGRFMLNSQIKCLLMIFSHFSQIFRLHCFHQFSSNVFITLVIPLQTKLGVGMWSLCLFVYLSIPTLDPILLLNCSIEFLETFPDYSVHYIIHMLFTEFDCKISVHTFFCICRLSSWAVCCTQQDKSVTVAWPVGMLPADLTRPVTQLSGAQVI